MNKEELQEENQFEALIQGLIDNEYGCCDDFILPGIMSGLSDNIHRLSKSEKLISSGVGNKIDFKKDSSVRGDKINWIKDESTDPFEMI